MAKLQAPTMITGFSQEQRKRIDEARMRYHLAILQVLRERDVLEYVNDVTEAGEGIALEGTIFSPALI